MKCFWTCILLCMCCSCIYTFTSVRIWSTSSTTAAVCEVNGENPSLVLQRCGSSLVSCGKLHKYCMLPCCCYAVMSHAYPPDCTLLICSLCCYKPALQCNTIKCKCNYCNTWLYKPAEAWLLVWNGTGLTSLYMGSGHVASLLMAAIFPSVLHQCAVSALQFGNGRKRRFIRSSTLTRNGSFSLTYISHSKISSVLFKHRTKTWTEMNPM